MDEIEVEYVLHENLMRTALDQYKRQRIPVVRLDAVDQVLKEAVWAMQLVVASRKSNLTIMQGLRQGKDRDLGRAEQFLVTVAAFRARQEGPL